VFVFLDVIPYEPIFEPNSLLLSQAEILKRWTMGYDKSFATLATHNGRHNHCVLNDDHTVRHSRDVATQPSGCAK
jgi:uncharacterized membrane protein